MIHVDFETIFHLNFQWNWKGCPHECVWVWKEQQEWYHFLRVLTHLKSFLYWVDPTIIIFTTTKPDSFIVLNSEIDIDQLLYCLSQKNVYKKRNLKLSFTSTSKTCFSHKQWFPMWWELTCSCHIYIISTKKSSKHC